MWIASPIMYLAVLFMALSTIWGYTDGKETLFIIELVITFVFALSVVFLKIQFRYHTKYVLKSAKKILMAENVEDINNLSLPTVITGLEGDIFYANNAFLNDVDKNENLIGDSIVKYISPKTLNQISRDKFSSVMYNDKLFTVYPAKNKDGYVFYFVNDTYYKNTTKEHFEKKIVISLISFDNKEEILRDASGGEESRITSEVENQLRTWSHEMGGFMRKLSSGERYMLLSDEKHMKKARENKFDILDRVRTIKGTGEQTATISIGVGRECENAAESERKARQALQMALGRGGDQVAIMNKNYDYEFFGGVSQGFEKRDKVRTRVIAETLTEHIKKADKVYVMGHKFSDLDSLGSCIGMWAIAHKTLKKPSSIVINRSQSLAKQLIDPMLKAYPNERVFISPSEAGQEISKNTIVIVTDTHSPALVESAELLKSAKTIVVIDHHRLVVNYIKNSVIFHHEPYASSASEMVAELIEYIDNKAINSVEAQSLMAGISLDTKNFVMKTGIRTFEASAFLKRRGADTIAVKKLFSGTLEEYQEKSKLISSAEVYNNCAIAKTEVTTPSIRISSSQAADELLSINGVIASFSIYKVGNDVNISARSFGELNVQIILEAFGGGGHLTMAGAQVKDSTVAEVIANLKIILDEKLNKER